MNNYLLLIFPLAIIIILFFKAGINAKGQFNDKALTISQGKALQATAALMIILHHMVQTITKYDDIYKGPINEWNSFGILFTSIFFFFSGFGLYKSYKNKENYLGDFLNKRLPKIIIPFIVTNIIYFIILSADRISSLRHVFTSILGLTLINTNTWFLVEIIILYLAFYFFFSRAKSEAKALRNLSIFVVALVLISLLLCHDNSQINGHWFMGEWWYNTTLIFVMGLYVARNESKIISYLQKNYKNILPINLVALILVYLAEEYVLNVLGYYQEWAYHPGYLAKIITLLIQVILCVIFILFMILINLKIEFKNRALSFLGGISLEIYLVHDVFRQTLYTKDKMPDWEYFILVFVLSIISAYLLSLIDKFLIDFYEDNIILFKSFRLKADTSELSYESKQKLNRKRKIINSIKIVGICLFCGMIISELAFVFDYTVTSRQKYNSEIEALRSANISDKVYFGEYLLDYKKAEYEPLSWTVIAKDDNHILLLCDMVLANEIYHDHHAETTWKNSKLCRILNHDFYHEAFTRLERKLLSGRYDGTNDSWYCPERKAFQYYINVEGEYDEEDVIVNTELVFLLTKEEINKYLPNPADRIAPASPVAKDQGIGTINTDYMAPWWIQDLAQGDCKAMYVEIDGSIHEEGKTINNSGMGVRPAIWVKLP